MQEHKTKSVRLTQGKRAIVDAELFDELNKFKWCASKRKRTWYAMRGKSLPNGRWTTIAMHREIFELLGKPIPKSVDHKDGNGLNNQRENLRGATNSDQQFNRSRLPNNTSRFIGVSWNKHARRWRAGASVAGKAYCLGYFRSKFSAAWVRDAFVREHHGEFASLNNLKDRRNVSLSREVERRVRGDNCSH